MKSNLKQIRKEEGLTMQQLADKAGTCKSQIHLMEKDDYNPGLRNAVAVADALDLTIYDIWIEIV